MMKPLNWKKALAVLATAGMVTGVVSCSGASSPAAPASAGGELTFANYQWLEPKKGDVLWEAMTSYQKVNDKAVLKKSEAPFNQYADKINTEIGAGGGPDLIVMQDSQFATLSDAGVLEPLDDAVAGAGLNSSNDDLKIGGKQYGVTWELINYGLIGNKNLMAQAGVEKMPTTVDELIAAGKKIEAATGADGFAVRHMMSEFSGWLNDFDSWIYGAGGSWSDGTKLTIDSKENIAGVAAFKKVYDSGIMPNGDDASTFRAKFKEGKLGFMIDNSGVPVAMTSGQGLKGTDMVASALPFQSPGQHQKLVLAVNANSKNKELAKNFIKWFASKDGQTIASKALSPSSVASDVPLSTDFLAANPWAEVYPTLSADSKSILIKGFETETKPIKEIILQAVERVLAQNEDPAQALKRAQEQASAR